MKKRSMAVATIGAALAFLPFFSYGRTSMNSGPAQEPEADNVIQFNLVPTDVIAHCFPNAVVKVKVLLTEDELGTDTMILTGKGLPPNTSFAAFLTEGVPLVGAVQYLANLHTNANGKGSVVVNAIVKDAFVNQAIDGQRVRKDLNHVVIWFADPADANACFAPANAPTTPFDGDGVAGPVLMSSQNALPGAPLP